METESDLHLSLCLASLMAVSGREGGGWHLCYHGLTITAPITTTFFDFSDMHKKSVSVYVNDALRSTEVDYDRIMPVLLSQHLLTDPRDLFSQNSLLMQLHFCIFIRRNRRDTSNGCCIRHLV